MAISKSKSYIILKDLNKAISKIIIRKLNLKNGYLHPPTFNINIKYLIMGMNPSNNKRDKSISKESDSYMLTLGKFANKKIKRGNRKPIIFPGFFDRQYKLLCFDKKIKLFWQNKQHFKSIVDKRPEWEDLFNTIRKKFVNDKNSDKYIAFNELLYVKEKKQKKITSFLNDNHNIEAKIITLFLQQLDFYKPKNLIINNAYVSDFVREKVYKTNKPVSYLFDKKRKINIFFSSMLTKQRALDKYNFIRLANEIKKYNR